jgi:catechol 2,3-dioxygenase-like lactoylglutathione lyase family enzyme
LQLQDVKLRAIYLERDGTVIELLHFASPGSHGEPDGSRPLNRHGLTHLSFQVDDVDTVLDRVARLGGRALDPTRVGSGPDTSVIFCTDPDGTLIELVRRGAS